MVGGTAKAEDGPFLGVSVGGGALGDLDGSDGFTSTFLPGPTLSVAGGYKWQWLRVEGELFYAYFLLDDQAGPSGERPPPPPSCFLCGTTGEVSGDLSALAFMANTYGEFNLSDNVRLFVGAGIGWARVAADYHFNVTFIGFPTESEIDVVDDADVVLAYQGKLGIAFGVGESSEIYLAYRYFATEDMSFDVRGGGQLDQDGMQIHIGEVGFRFQF